MDIFSKFIEENPNKVLGEISDKKGMWGSEIIIGSVENLDAIDVPESLEPKVENAGVDTIHDNIEEQNVLRVIKESKKQSKRTRRKKPKGDKSALPRDKKLRKLFEGKEILRKAGEPIELWSFDDTYNMMNKHLTNDQTACWVWYQNKIGNPMGGGWTRFMPKTSDTWFKLQLEEGNLCIENGDYVTSVLYYSGNIYDKIDELKRSPLQDSDPAQYQRQLKGLENVKPDPLLLEEGGLILSPISKYVEDFEIYSDGDLVTIYNGFVEYLMTFDKSEMKKNVSPKEIVDFYLMNKRRPHRTYSTIEFAQVKRNGAIEASRLMKEYLNSYIQVSERKRIEADWNKKYNGYVEPSYANIPVAFECSRYFKDFELDFRDEKREGVAFSSIRGTGMLAWDVGVGKTMGSIMCLAQALEAGQCKRPLVVVPKGTYNNWMMEIGGLKDLNGNVWYHGILENYNLLGLANMNDSAIKNLPVDEAGNPAIPEGTVTVITYEGLNTIGIDKERGNDIIQRVSEIINQGYHNESERQQALDDKKLDEIFGIAVSDTRYHVDTLGFDYLLIDEAHNFNKSFVKAKGFIDPESDKKKRESSRYGDIGGGKTSKRSVKAFFLSQYIQMTNSGRNVLMLTATPFNNNPLEVFSILALTNYKRMSDFGVNNINIFCDTYINQTFENTVNTKNEFVQKAVVKSFNNKISLQKLLFGFMNYKSGQDVGVERPKKWVIPMMNEITEDGVRLPLPRSKQILSFLEPTPIQKQNISAISDWLSDAESDPDLAKKAPHLVAINNSKKNTLCPYLYDIKDIDAKGVSETVEYFDFVESSPKLRYTMECIKSVKKWHEARNESVSGQVIYINGAREWHGKIKEYLEKVVGFKQAVSVDGKVSVDEVMILNSGTTEGMREVIKDAFLKGTVKVLIGTQSIREGINLQSRSTVLYNLWMDWNPTDVKQLEGRIWRQGNMYTNVRIVTPLLVGSSDLFIFQKVEEKTDRINDLFDRNSKDNILDTSSISPDEVKWSLIDDVADLAKLKIKESIEKKKMDIAVLEDSRQQIKGIELDMANMEGKVGHLKGYCKSYKDRFSREREEWIDGEWVTLPSIFEEAFGEDLEYDDANPDTMISFLKRILRASKKKDSIFYINKYRKDQIELSIKQYRRYKKNLEKARKVLDEKYGMDFSDDFDPVIESMDKEISAGRDELAFMRSPEHLEEVTQKLEKEKQEFDQGIGTFEEAVERFESLNYLLGYKKEEKKKKQEEPKPEPKEEPTVDEAAEAELLLEIEIMEMEIELLEAEEPEKKPEPANPQSNESGFSIGDILYTSWGYEQTNVDFYQVVGLAGKKTVKIRQINSKIDESKPAGHDSDYVLPVKDDFKYDEVISKRPNKYGQIKLESYMRLVRWDGKSKYRSWGY